jgi:hypothetical protein
MRNFRNISKILGILINISRNLEMLKNIKDSELKRKAKKSFQETPEY